MSVKQAQGGFVEVSYVEVECSDRGYVFFATNPYRSKDFGF